MVEVIGDAADPRLDGYRRLNDGRYRARYERHAGLLVAEGHLAAARLVESAYPVHSVVVASPKVGSMERLIAGARAREAAVYSVPPPVLDEAAGFPVHRGVLALGGRLPLAGAGDVLGRPGLVLAVEAVNDGENMGALLRNAAAFGAGVLLDPRCCDPLSRRAVRVSVGHALGVTLARGRDWPADLAGAARSGAVVVALTPDPSAPPLGQVCAWLGEAGPRPVVLVVGAEGPGLSPAAVATASTRARIAMAPGVDSLNVATAAAIAMHGAARAMAGAGADAGPPVGAAGLGGDGEAEPLLSRPWTRSKWRWLPGAGAG